MLTTTDKDYLDNKFVTNDRFDKAMDAIGERFDTNEEKLDQILQEQRKLTSILLDALGRSQKLEEKQSDHSYQEKTQNKRLDRIEDVLELPVLAI